MEEGGKMQNEEMSKPVKIALLWLHITKLGHCYYFPSFKIPGLGETWSIKVYFASPDTCIAPTTSGCDSESNLITYPWSVKVNSGEGLCFCASFPGERIHLYFKKGHNPVHNKQINMYIVKRSPELCKMPALEMLGWTSPLMLARCPHIILFLVSKPDCGWMGWGYYTV